MAIQGADGLQQRIRVFEAYHVDDLPRRQAELLVLIAVGLSNADAASSLQISMQTLHRHSAEARTRVVPPAYEGTRDNAQFWACAHRNCCLATAFAALGRTG